MTHKWEAMSNISGEQIGSYFGGSVCVLDLNSDSNTDFLVVGAPLYYKPHPQREGRIYIYRLTQQLKLEKELEICESAQGRFGMTLAAVADLNGDQLQDLAVGAPLEDNQKGAIYIYLGNHEHGIRPQYSQRIVASSISKQLQHFGLAIDGVMDMGQDGLTDIAVGAQGTVLLLNKNLFNNVESGADPEANKALVIITDGSPSDINTNEIQRCEELSITRFIIGVGKIDNFEKLNKLASEPKESNIFKIENYDGLNGLLDKLQNKIYGIEECTKSKVNLVFLFDGSSSMQASDFDKNKKFIWDVVTTLKNSSIEFAAVQFSKTVSTVFTFKDYVNGMAKKKLDAEKHMKSLTNTHKAIDFTLEVATDVDFTNLEEYATSVTSSISKCIDDITVSKTITTRSNQKPWMTAEVRALLKT
ncbi:hypothetical protein PDJAM_G00163490 [Pangasius djambal]|uniref:Uncharacterized protein n=1 Tax=Pangasius djambal TaxID=1691987 RepID=A0ACC5ZME3_9TELE|nr:hypothetical protein [Pangasius djambal]